MDYKELSYGWDQYLQRRRESWGVKMGDFPKTGANTSVDDCDHFDCCECCEYC